MVTQQPMTLTLEKFDDMLFNKQVRNTYNYNQTEYIDYRTCLE